MNIVLFALIKHVFSEKIIKVDRMHYYARPLSNMHQKIILWMVLVGYRMSVKSGSALVPHASSFDLKTFDHEGDCESVTQEVK